MIYSKTCEYALRAMACLAKKPDATRMMIPEISEATGVPMPYLAKIFQALARKKILRSMRGPGGGFSLTRPAGEVSLREVVEAVDDFSRLNDCVMGLDRCEMQNACPLHEVWVQAKKKLLARMEQQTILDLTKRVGRVRFRRLRRSYLNQALGLSTCSEKEAA